MLLSNVNFVLTPRLFHNHNPSIQGVLGSLSLVVNWPGHEAGHSLLSSAKVKNAWSCTSTSPIGLHGVVLN